MPDITRKIERVLEAEDDVQIADSQKFDVILGIPKWMVVGYLLYRLTQEGGRWKDKPLPSKSVRLMKALSEIE